MISKPVHAAIFRLAFLTLTAENWILSGAAACNLATSQRGDLGDVCMPTLGILGNWDVVFEEGFDGEGLVRVHCFFMGILGDWVVMLMVVIL
jgi:hypothetical protein